MKVYKKSSSMFMFDYNYVKKFFRSMYFKFFAARVFCSRPDKKSNNLTIRAIVTCYNEADIIEQTIDYLSAQGIDVHVIDNWSTDESFDIVKKKAATVSGVTYEQFPVNGPSDTYDWTNILTRVQEYAMEHHKEVDWFIHHDADEVRESPFSEKQIGDRSQSLRRGIEIVDAAGYNAINHTVLNFVPIPDGFDGSQNASEYFHHFAFGEGRAYQEQVKAWKSQLTVDLATSGGHMAEFAGRKIFPYNFLLRHYPLRSKKQAAQKIFRDRKARWNAAEREKNWHQHYDHFTESDTLTWDPNDYLVYNKESFAHDFLVERLSGTGKRIIKK